eukprot:11003709-Karenia_brevis.AAC.1
MWTTRCGEVFKWCRDAQCGGVPPVLQKPDGSYTGNSSEMDKLLLDAWLPIFCKWNQMKEPDWNAFEERFTQHIVEHPLNVSRINGMELQQVLQRMSGSPGLDGWRVSELKALPIFFLNLLADFLDTVERTGQWPKALLVAGTSLIDKGLGPKPADLRPITVMSCVYRLWAARRLKDLRTWQESWIPLGLHGFRAGHSVQDIFWKLGLAVEES